MEAPLGSRIQNAIQQSKGLSENQYGFRKCFSTIGATRSVTAAVERSSERCDGARQVVLVATLNVKNAFNSARWQICSQRKDAFLLGYADDVAVVVEEMRTWRNLFCAR